MQPQIKFLSKHKSQQQFATAVRKNVNAYFTDNGISTKGNYQLVLYTIMILGIYIAPIVLLLTIDFNLITAASLMSLSGFGLAGVGMGVMHDGVHGSFSTKKWVNKLVGSSMYLLGSTVLNWRIQHNYLHHTFTNISGFDKDIQSRGPLRLSYHEPLSKIHGFQFIYAFFLYGFMSIARLVGDFPLLFIFNKNGLTRKSQGKPAVELVKMIVSKLIFLFVLIALPIWVTPFTWWQVLIGFVIMQWIGSVILAVIFQMAHVVEGASQPLPVSDGSIHSEWMVHELETTADFARNSTFLHWYSGGLNFQIEHHLFPNICHIHYRNIAPIVERTALEYGLPYNLKPTFMNALNSHIRTLRDLGSPLPQ